MSDNTFFKELFEKLLSERREIKNSSVDIKLHQVNTSEQMKYLSKLCWSELNIVEKDEKYINECIRNLNTQS